MLSLFKKKPAHGLSSDELLEFERLAHTMDRDIVKNASENIYKFELASDEEMRILCKSNDVYSFNEVVDILCTDYKRGTKYSKSFWSFMRIAQNSEDWVVDENADGENGCGIIHFPSGLKLFKEYSYNSVARPLDAVFSFNEIRLSHSCTLTLFGNVHRRHNAVKRDLVVEAFNTRLEGY
jgi:hypothetical protein